MESLACKALRSQVSVDTAHSSRTMKKFNGITCEEIPRIVTCAGIFLSHDCSHSERQNSLTEYWVKTIGFYSELCLCNTESLCGCRADDYPHDCLHEEGRTKLTWTQPTKSWTKTTQAKTVISMPPFQIQSHHCLEEDQSQELVPEAELNRQWGALLASRLLLMRFPWQLQGESYVTQVCQMQVMIAMGDALWGVAWRKTTNRMHRSDYGIGQIIWKVAGPFPDAVNQRAYWQLAGMQGGAQGKGPVQRQLHWE